MSETLCPFCSTKAPVAQDAFGAVGHWQCVRCGQVWDDRRLATVAEYAAWVVAHDARAAASLTTK